MTEAPTVKAPPKATKVTDAQLRDYIRANYPDYAGFLSHPELGKILTAAARGKWDAAKLYGRLTKTEWWRRRDEQQRAWDGDYLRDRRTGESILAQTRTQITRLANRLGVTLDAEVLGRLALNVNRNGWSMDQVQEAVATRFSLADKQPQRPGAGLTTVAGLREQAAQYLVDISDAALTQWTRQILGGTRSPEDFQTYLRDFAKGRWGDAVAERIEAGQTVRQLFDPYVQEASQILGVNPDAVDLREDRWKAALQTWDPQIKQFRPATDAEWRRTLRTDPRFGYDTTENGRREGAAFAQQMGSIFGLPVGS